MALITIVLKTGYTEVREKNLYTYHSSVTPRVGDFVELDDNDSYVIDRVIHKISNGSSNVVLEVKKV